MIVNSISYILFIYTFLLSLVNIAVAEFWFNAEVAAICTHITDITSFSETYLSLISTSHARHASFKNGTPHCYVNDMELSRKTLAMGRVKR